MAIWWPLIAIKKLQIVHYDTSDVVQVGVGMLRGAGDYLTWKVYWLQKMSFE